MGGQCQYVHEENPESEGEQLQDWECPHDIADVSDDRCLFHLREETREQVAHERITDAFLKRSTEPGRKSKEFIGAHIKLLSIDFQRISAPDNHPIDLRSATIETLSSNYANFEQPLLLTNAEITTAEFTQSTFESPCDINSANIIFLDSIGVRFAEYVSIKNSTLGAALFDDSTFEKKTDIRKTTFRVGASFHSVTFNAPVNFTNSEFYSPYTNLDNPESEEKRWMEHHLSIEPLLYGRRAVDPKQFIDDPVAEIPPPDDEQIYYAERDFVSENFTHFNDTTLNGGDFRETNFYDRCEFDSARLEYADFGNAGFHSRASFIGTQIYGTIHFHAVYFDNAELRFLPLDTGSVYNEESQRPTIDLRHKARVYLTSSVLNKGLIRQPNTGEVYYDLSDGQIGDLNIVSATNAFEYILIDNTEFDGFDFTEYREDLEEINWNIDSSTVSILGEKIQQYRSDREVTYLKAKQGASQVGDTTAESEFFQREMKFRCYRYGSNISTDEPFWKMYLDLLHVMTHVTANQLYRFTCGYGEKPYRVVVSYVSIVIGLSVFLMLPNLAYGEIELFLRGVREASQMLALGREGPSPQWFSDIMGIFRTLIIPSFISLLVFTLSRSIER